MDADKNLGVTLIDRATYIKSILKEHLLQRETYEILSKLDASRKLQQVEDDIKNTVISSNELQQNDKTFFYRSFRKQYRIPTFYGTPKLHKGSCNGLYKTRPVISKIGSFIEIASKYCDHHLTKLIPKVDSYLKDSFTLLHDLSTLGNLPPNAKLITADAISMYTNIDTDHGLQILSEFINEYSSTVDPDFPSDTVIKLLTIVMKNNIFTFGDLFFLQKCGTAMGTIVAVKYATIYCASHEQNFILPKYRDQFIYFKRYIDDIFLIWLPGPINWKDLITDLRFGKMKWEVNNPAKMVNFLDLTIWIDPSGKISTKTYEKPLNLHLYLPSSSAHPTGTLKSLIFGFLRRYWLMNTHVNDYINQVKKFATRLQNRGYTKTVIETYFNDAAVQLQQQFKHTKRYINQKKKNTSNDKILFLKKTFHPRSFSNKQVQHLFKKSFQNIDLFDRLIVCNKRPKNLRDILMPSTLASVEKMNPSDYLHEVANNC